MRNFVKISLVIFLLLNVGRIGAQIPTWTGNGSAGTLAIAYKTATTGGSYSPKNVMTCWISTQSSGTNIVLKTIVFYAATRKSSLTTWSALGLTPDVTSGATLSNYGTYSLSWDGKDKNGNLVDDGTYTVHFEVSDYNPPTKSQVLVADFVKGTASQTVSPANVKGFSGVSLIWTPSVTTIVPSVSIATTKTTICAGSTATFTATPTNGGTSPTYQWKVNGANVGTNSSVFTTSTIANTNTVTCVMTSNASGATPPTATSNTITMTVTPTVTPSIIIATTTPTICSGVSNTFTATPTNGGTPSYQWKKGTTNVGTNLATYTDASLLNNDAISCVMTSSAVCPSSSTATSNIVNVTVNANSTPSVTINTPNSTICTGTSTTFTATPINGGTLPSYQWKKGTTSIGTNSNIYVDASLMNNDAISCVMTSNATCKTTATATSSTITMNVSNSVVPSITISTPSTTICTGSSTIFTATTSNGGTPTYQWKKNGVNVGTNIANYTDASLLNNDIISCELTSSNACASPLKVSSNSITMTVTGSVTPSVIIATPISTICSGASTTFTATPTNGGGAPSYQWQVNGLNVGTNTATYSNSSLANNDIISCKMTSSSACASTSNVSSNALTMTVNTSVIPSVTIATANTTICSGASTTFTATPINGGIPVYQWKKNGLNVGTNTATYIDATLSNNDAIVCNMTSSVNCALPVLVSSSTITMTVNSSVTPSVIIATPSPTVCSAVSILFTATPTNGGSPSYQWTKNGINVGNNTATYSDASLINNDAISCIMTSTANCTTKPTANSATITMTVSASIVPSVSISTPNTTICTGTAAVFTATPSNGGTPTYQWKKNGVNVGTNSVTHSSAALVNNDIITCVMTSTANCASILSVTSAPIVMTVNAKVSPSITINASQTSVCSGTTVLFTATPTYGGSTPQYQWKKNGVNVGTNLTTYSDAALANNDVIICNLTSNYTCLSTTTASSNTITISTSLVTPSVTISTLSTSVCQGSNTLFTAIPINGGSSPSFQWKKNGNNVGTNSSTYSDNTLANSDIISCVMTSNATCTSTSVATSNVLTMSVNPVIIPSLVITTPSQTICSSASVTFTASPTNGGTPTYQWKKNGLNVGTSTASYIDASLLNSDVVSCNMTSTAICATPTVVSSNNLTMTVNSSVTPSIVIATPKTSICSGTSTTFTATPTNGGLTPTYQWKRNGTIIGTNSATHTTASISNNDVISCVMTGSLGCATTLTANSNSITMSVSATVIPSISISTTNTNICSGTNVTISAISTNGGTPIYQWKKNGANVGTNSASYVDASLLNNDIVLCEMTSSVNCASPNLVISNPITMTVNSLITPTVIIGTPNSNICSGTSTTFTATPTNGGTTPLFQWKSNGLNVGTNSANYTSSTITDNDIISCVMTSNASCLTTSNAISNDITMAVQPLLTPSVIVNTANTTVCSGKSVDFTATPTNEGTPTYQWKKNGFNVGTNQATYTDNTLANNDVISCDLTSSSACSSPNIISSNLITMTINSIVVPSISIDASQTNICEGTTVDFTAIPTNGGSPIYQWKKNGVNVGANQSIYSENVFVNNDVVSCEMISNVSCASQSPILSNNLTITVNTNNIPSISIKSDKTSICEGQTISFVATPSKAGTPVYQWKKNGGNVGGNVSNYSDNALNNLDVISCEITGSGNCISTTPVLSNTIEVSITPNVIPSVTISVPSTIISAGTEVIFTAIPTNGGTSPSYQWKKNDINVGTNTSKYIDLSIIDKDVISCIMTSNDICAIAQIANSSVLTMQINPIKITTDISNINAVIGSNVIIKFDATPASSIFQWQVDDGSGNGFVDIVASTQYTGIHRNELGIKAIPESFNNYKYRCIVITSDYSFTDTSAVAKVSVLATGISDVNQKSETYVYPIVAQDAIAIVTTDLIIGQLFNIIDCKGNIVVKSKLLGNQTIVPVSQLATGSYFVVFPNTTQAQIQFIKK